MCQASIYVFEDFIRFYVNIPVFTFIDGGDSCQFKENKYDGYKAVRV